MEVEGPGVASERGRGVSAKKKTVTLTAEQAEFAIAELTQRAKTLGSIVTDSKKPSPIVVDKAVRLKALLAEMKEQLA